MSEEAQELLAAPSVQAGGGGPPAAAPMPKARRMALGAACVAVVVATWVGQAELLHVLGDEVGGWHKPFALSFGIHAAWALALPAALLVRRLARGPLPGLPWRRLALFAVVMAPLITAGNACWYYSLGITQVSVNTAAYNSNFLMVFALSMVLLREKMTIFKVNGTVQALAGLAMMAAGSFWSAAAADNNEPMGYVFLLLSMATYAMLSVLFAKIFPPKISRPFSRTPILGLAGIGAVGVVNILVMWSGLLILNYAGVEKFEWPYGNGLKSLLISSVMDIILNVALLAGALIMSPTFMAVGSLLSIPVGIVVQLIFQRTVINWVQGVGVVFVTIGAITFELGGKIVKYMATRKKV